MKTALMAGLVFFNLLFVSAFFMFVGFLLGNVNAEQSHSKGLEFGYHQGKYEIYLEMQERQIGKYNDETDEFDYYELDQPPK
jgi:hypothetical protein